MLLMSFSRFELHSNIYRFMFSLYLFLILSSPPSPQTLSKKIRYDPDFDFTHGDEEKEFNDFRTSLSRLFHNCIALAPGQVEGKGGKRERRREGEKGQWETKRFVVRFVDPFILNFFFFFSRLVHL